MKKVVLFLAIVAGIALSACGGKKADQKSTDKDAATTTTTTNDNTDTIVVDYGTVSLDSISPDSAAIVVQDTTVEITAVPVEKEQKK